MNCTQMKFKQYTAMAMITDINNYLHRGLTSDMAHLLFCIPITAHTVLYWGCYSQFIAVIKH